MDSRAINGDGSASTPVMGTSQDPQEIANLNDVTVTMPWSCILDCGAALDCIGEVDSARTAQTITALRETHHPTIVDKLKRFRFGGDCAPIERSFPLVLPNQIGEAKTWLDGSKFVVPGSTLHLVSQRWLSQHQCLVNFDPNFLCLECSSFGSVRLVLHSSAHLLLSLVNPSNTVGQYTVVVDYQNPSSELLRKMLRSVMSILVQEKLQRLSQCQWIRRSRETASIKKRTEADERRAAEPPLARDRVDHPTESLADPNEKITEQCRKSLHDWCTCRDTGQCSNNSVTPSPIVSADLPRPSESRVSPIAISSVCPVVPPTNQSTSAASSCRKRPPCTISVRTDRETASRETHRDSQERSAIRLKSLE